MKEHSASRPWFQLSSIGLLALILVLGFGLRLYGLGDESLWLDEGTSVRTASLPTGELLARLARPDTPPPLFHLLLHVWIKRFGDSEAAVRLLPLLFGVLSVFMVYKVGRLLFGARTGLLAALLVAASPFHIQFSQEARMYSLMVFLVLASYYFFLRLLQEGARGPRLAYVLFSVLLLYTHVYGWFFLGAQAASYLTLLLARPRPALPLGTWLKLQAAIVLLFAPWMVLLVQQVLRVQEGFWIREPGLPALSNAFVRYAGSWLLLGLFALLAGIAFLEARRQDRTRHGQAQDRAAQGLSARSKWSVLAVWAVIPVLVPIGLSLILQPFFISRYGIGASVAIFLLAAKGLSSIPVPLVRVGLVVLILAAAGAVLVKQYQKVDKEQWREAAAYVNANARPQDLVVVHAGFALRDIFSYYYNRTDVTAKPYPTYKGDITRNTTQDLLNITAGADRVWLVLSHSRDRQRLIVARLNESLEQMLDLKFVGVEVLRFDRRGDPRLLQE